MSGVDVGTSGTNVKVTTPGQQQQQHKLGGIGLAGRLGGLTNPILSPLSRLPEDGPLLKTSRFLKSKGQPQIAEARDKYSPNTNLVLRSRDQENRTPGLKGFLDRLEGQETLNRSLSGSSYGSGNSSGTISSSGYGSDNKSDERRLHVEVESEEEGGEEEVVVVSGQRQFTQAIAPSVNLEQLKTLPKHKKNQSMTESETRGGSADTLGNSITSFLKRTDHLSEESKAMRRDRELSLNRELMGSSSPYNRDIRSSSVARASSVGRQFEPSPSSLYAGVRGGSVARQQEYQPQARQFGQFEVPSRDPFYSNITRTSFSRGMRETSVPVSRVSGGLGPLPEYRTPISPTPSISYKSPNDGRRVNGNGMRSGNIGNGAFRSLEDECNWILSGRDPVPDNLNGDNLDEEDENTLDDISGDELSEMTADLADDTANTTTQKEKVTKMTKKKRDRDQPPNYGDNLSRSSNLSSFNKSVINSRFDRAYSLGPEMNGHFSAMDDVGEGDSIYRSKYERAIKDLEYTKKRLAQQHEDDLDQLLSLKKQLEKKLNEAYEDVDEHRKDAAKWKKKFQTIQGEVNDTRILLDEQAARSSLIENKMRKCEVELTEVAEARYKRELAFEKLQKDFDAMSNEKGQLLDEIKKMKSGIDSKDDRILELQKEIDDLTKNTAVQDEVNTLKKQKQSLVERLKDQEDELDDLTGKVQILDNARTKLEMQLAAEQREHRRELESKEEDLENTKSAANKKIKIIEQQLEQEHDDRINFLREKHELEGRVLVLQEALERSGDEEQILKLKKDLKRTKILLKDAQTQLEKTQTDGTNKTILRQLKNQLEDAEFARAGAMKARQNAEQELAESQHQLEEMSRSKLEVEGRLQRLGREKADITNQLQENEDELQDVLKRFKVTVNTVAKDQHLIQELQIQNQELECERNKLKESLAEMTNRLTSKEGQKETAISPEQMGLELKVKELTSRLELEHTTKGRLETQIARLKETVEKNVRECDELKMSEIHSQEQIKKLSRQLKDAKEDYSILQGKEAELGQKKEALEKQAEMTESEMNQLRSELKGALDRIQDLQIAISGEIDTDHSDNEDCEEMQTFNEHHRRAMSVQRERESMAREIILRESVAREMSMARGESVLRETSMARELRSIRGDSLLRETSMARDIRTSRGDSLLRESSMVRDVRGVRGDSLLRESSVVREGLRAARGDSLLRELGTAPLTTLGRTISTVEEVKEPVIITETLKVVAEGDETLA